MKNKKGLLVRDVVIAGVLFTGIIAIFIILVANMATNYDRTDIISEDFSNNYNKLNQLSEGENGVSVSQNAIQNVSGLQLQGTFNGLFSSTWVVLNLVWNSVDIFASMGANMISDFTFLDAGVIKILIYVLMTILITIVIFNIISSVTQGRL